MGVLVGMLAGLLLGMAVCARYLRQEIAANIGPRLRHIERQLNTLQSEVSLAAETSLAALRKHVENDERQE